MRRWGMSASRPEKQQRAQALRLDPLEVTPRRIELLSAA